jgi:small subunit ribosomal protein S13
MALTLFGRPLPPERRVVRALPLLPGLGQTRANEVCRRLGFPPALRVEDLTSGQESLLARRLKNEYTVAGQLAEERAHSIARLRANGSRRGQRLRRGLPVRGQRTQTNAQSSRRVRTGLTTTR